MLNINLWWVKELFPKRHDGYVFDAWNGKYPTFKASRREMIKIYIRNYRNKK